MTGKKDATKAAKDWLSIVDSGGYGDSWEEASDYSKNIVGRDHWESSLRGARAPLGAVKKRTLKETEYHTSLPGAPDGEYFVIQYETEFENKSKATEIVTPKKEGKDWRVSGYYIR